MTDYLGSEELSEEQQLERAAQYEHFIKGLDEAISTSQEAKTWLNTGMGKAVRETILLNKIDALKRAADMDSDEAETKKAKEDYTVWSRVESVFGAIIMGGEEALKQYQQMEMNNEQ